jgi:hypothetical protein
MRWSARPVAGTGPPSSPSALPMPLPAQTPEGATGARTCKAQAGRNQCLRHRQTASLARRPSSLALSRSSQGDSLGTTTVVHSALVSSRSDRVRGAVRCRPGTWPSSSRCRRGCTTGRTLKLYLYTRAQQSERPCGTIPPVPGARRTRPAAPPSASRPSPARPHGPVPVLARPSRPRTIDLCPASTAR